MKSKIISGIAVLIFASILWYFMLPPMNITSPVFWSYIIILLITGTFIMIPSIIIDLASNKRKRKSLPKKALIAMYIITGTFIIIVAINIFYSPLLNSKMWANRITVDETKEFKTNIKEVDFNKIPLLDKDSSEKLGDRKMGQATEWVSQFYVSDMYTQINYNDKIIRVTPIEYASFIKYLTNKDEGIKGYITVDSVNGEANLVTMKEGIKYTTSAYFFENVHRKLRINHPTKIFDKINFEIDNDGHPYWIAPTIEYKGVGIKKEINGAVILDAVTGESKYYEVNQIPNWVDHVYSPSLVIEQLNNWGEYKEGFINSIFGQKNVVNTTEGYNYLVMNDDVYLYTGITSVSSDESNLGFVLTNLRTKETNYYSAPGAEEFSAMASAEGLVQEKDYEASFPLLINLKGKPTYLLSLKDDAGLVKMYAFVDVEDYQKVIVNDAALGIEAAAKKYLGEKATEYDSNNLKEAEIKIKNITTAMIDGNTYYYITDINNNLYTASIKIDRNTLPFLKSNDTIKVSYSEANINQIATVEKK